MKAKCSLFGTIVVTCLLLSCIAMAGVYEDDFDDNDIGDWEQVGDVGEVRTEDGQLFMGVFGERLILLSPISVKNFTASVDIKIVSGIQGGIVFRYQDPQRFYGFEQRSVKMRFRMGDQSIVLKDGVNQTSGQYMTYKLIAQDGNFRVFINDEEVLNVDDFTIPESGQIGIGICLAMGALQYGAFFDNFRVESDELRLAVSSSGKLTSTWSNIKIQR